MTKCFKICTVLLLMHIIIPNQVTKSSVGLSDNKGNTCFFHSALQALYHIPMFRNMILSAHYQQIHDPEYGKFIQTFINLLQKMQESKTTVDSGDFYDAMMEIAKGKKRFPSRNKPIVFGYRGEQHDVDEAAKLILEVIGDSCNNKIKKIYDIFRFSTQTQIKKNCRHETSKPPSIISSIDVIAGHYDESENYLPYKTLADCLNAYVSEEIISDVECDKCPLVSNKYQRVTARKKDVISTLPPILTIVIKRNYYDPNTDSIKKANHPINFEIKLDLTPYLSDDLKNKPHNKVVNYNLIAISCHSGSSGGGHYITYAKEGKMWWYFSDSDAHTVQESEVKKNGAIQVTLLFYEREDSLQQRLQTLKTSLQTLKIKLMLLQKKLKNLEATL